MNALPILAVPALDIADSIDDCPGSMDGFSTWELGVSADSGVGADGVTLQLRRTRTPASGK